MYTTKRTADDKVLTLSWNIATDPKLYRELAANPYSDQALRIISERFPDTSTADIIREVVLAEPEGRYDRNFKLLGVTQREEELHKQQDIFAEINKQLVQYCNKYAKEFDQLPRALVYSSLLAFVFRTVDLKEVEKKFSQNQRRDIKLSIVNFIENMQELTSVPEQIDNDSSFAAVTSDKKPILRRPFLQVGLVSFSFILLFSLITMVCAKQLEQRQKQSAAQYLQAKQISAIGVQKESQGLPVRLIIPAINVNAGIQHVGVTPKGEMETPSNAVDVGWFDFGPRPGERGSAVIAGHFNGKNGETGVFTNLHKLKKGDKLYIKDDKGTTTTFIVRESRTYDPGYAEEVFSRNDKAHLNLITCDGVWDGTKKNYSKRLVVFTDIID